MAWAFFIHWMDNTESNDGRNIRNVIPEVPEQEVGRVSRDVCRLN